MDSPVTQLQYTESIGMRWDNAKVKLRRADLSASQHSAVTPEIIAALSGNGKQATQKRKHPKQGTVTAETAVTVTETKQVTQKQKQATETKTAEWWQIVIVCFFVSLLSVTLTTLGLTMFAKWAGGILGGMFALYLLASVLVSRNRLKGDTSEQALTTVLYMEIGASVLHCFTFYVLLPETNDWLRVPAAGIMAGFVAFLSYKAVLFVRTYNAEI